ncbi:MAG: SRPBCC family protein [Polyangiaceae bacterium]
MKNSTKIERTSDRELVVTRTVNAPARIVFEAWSKAELFQKWWVPKSAGLNLLSCAMDVRTGGSYRLVFKVGDQEMAFFGTYVEVTKDLRIVWTNDENGVENRTISTVTFEEKDGKTLVVMTDLHPSKEALDEAIANGSTSGNEETFDQLDAFVSSR